MNKNNCFRCKHSLMRFNNDFMTVNREIPKEIDCTLKGMGSLVHLTSQEMAQIFNRGCVIFEEAT